MLRIEDVSAAYGAARVVDGLSLEVRDGEVVGLLGRNGMGKTTLVRAIAGMTPPTLRAGRIEWQGRDLAGGRSYAIARSGVGLVPQGRHVFGSLSVEENLTTTKRGNGAGGWTLERVYELFPRLRERRRNRAGKLSGGEQQMLAIGRALMTNPSLLLMDEPSEGLAPAVVDHIRELLEELKGELSILLVEQNLSLALALADRIYVLEAGGIVWQGDPAELRADPDLQRRTLGV